MIPLVLGLDSQGLQLMCQGIIQMEGESKQEPFLSQKEP